MIMKLIKMLKYLNSTKKLISYFIHSIFDRELYDHDEINFFNTEISIGL